MVGQSNGLAHRRGIPALDRGTLGAMKFVLEVDMGDTAWDGNAVAELGRILRYWAGNLKHYELKPGEGAAIYDSAYREVGQWTITAPPAAE